MGSLHQLFQELSESFSEAGSLNNAALAILRERPDDVLDLAHQKLHAYHYRNVPLFWAEIYTEAALWKCAMLYQARPSSWVEQTIELLDKTLIMTNGLSRAALICRLLHDIDVEI